MSYSDEEVTNDYFGEVEEKPKAVTRRTDDEPAKGPSNTALIAGLALAGVGIVAAVGARIILKKKPAVAPSRPSKSRAEGRRKVPPRRPRSTASDTRSEPRSPPSTASSTPFKAPVAAAAAAAAGAATATAATARRTGGPALPARPAAAKRPPAPKPAAPAPAAPAPAPAVPAEPTAEELKRAADAAVEQTRAAVAAGDVAAADAAAEALEDTVDDQIELMKEEAIEATVGLVEAAAEAEEAVEEAQAVLAHAEEAAEASAAPAAAAAAATAAAAAAAAPEKPAPAKKEAPKKKEEAPAPKKAAPAPTPAPAAAEKPEEVTKEAPAPAEAAEGASNGVAVPVIEPESFTLAEPLADEPEDQFETLDTIPHPELQFDEGLAWEGELNEHEKRVRDMSLAAHRLIKDNNHAKIDKAAREQGAAMDYCLGEAAGKVRPTLVAACAFALADMLIAQRKTNETRVALATAYDAAQRVENKGAAMRALMNYAYILRNEEKPASARANYASALALARETHGPSHPQVEHIKYEYTAYLSKTGRIDDAVKLLMESAEELETEAARLEKEGPAAEEAEKKAAKEKAAAEKAADPGTGLEHVEAEAAEEEEEGKPWERARHFAMRSLIHAGGLLDAGGRGEDAEGAFSKAIDCAIAVDGENSVAHITALHALGGHYRRQGRLQDAINACEGALGIMDATIEVYEPELLQLRVQLLRDTAMLYDKAGEPEMSVDYATGALVNMQTLAKIMASMPGSPPGAGHSIVEPFWMLLADLKAKAGDEEGAAEARREALRGKLNQGLASRGGRRGAPAGMGGPKRASSGSATRAGGRRV